jgi:hypothetical protein
LKQDISEGQVPCDAVAVLVDRSIDVDGASLEVPCDAVAVLVDQSIDVDGASLEVLAEPHAAMAPAVSSDPVEIATEVLTMFRNHLLALKTGSPGMRVLREYVIYRNLTGSNLPDLAVRMISLFETSTQSKLESLTLPTWDLSRCRGVLLALRRAASFPTSVRANGETNIAVICGLLIDAEIEKWPREEVFEFWILRLGYSYSELDARLS